MAVEIHPTKTSHDVAAMLAPLVKAVVSAVPAIIAHDPSTIASLSSNALQNVVDAALSLNRKQTTSLSYSGWEIIRSAYASGLVRTIQGLKLDRTPSSSELNELVSRLLTSADIFGEDNKQSISLEDLASPLKIEVLRRAARDLPHELKFFSGISTSLSPGQVRILFEECLFAGFKDVRNSHPAAFIALEDALSGSLSQAEDRRIAYGLHRQFLIKAFSLNPIFGQEDTGITLSDLYVRQRCIWATVEDFREPAGVDAHEVPEHARRVSSLSGRSHSKVRKSKHLHLDRLHEVLHQWLENDTGSDAVRVVAGGPGSGKSTFAKAFAVEVLDRGTHDVLFLPLQDIDSVGAFETRVGSLYRNRTELGFDRTPNPLSWLGCRESDGKPPRRPLLVICDGLDEIAAPDSKEASTVTIDFIQGMNHWLANRNSGGFFTRALILGRTIAAEEAFRKLAIDSWALLRMAGLLPLSTNEEWRQASRLGLHHDLFELAPIDQRVTYWQGWRRAKALGDVEIPTALNAEAGIDSAVRELTTEPLLLYLLLWTNYIGERWHQAADNRNYIYREIFYRIYRRDWGATSLGATLRRNVQRGGHTGTQELAIEDFELCQEALGLASWPSGGRTISLKTFKIVCEQFMTGDELADFHSNPNLSLKSIALQSYTRSSEGGDEGYEFVHKTLGEYLIAKALIRVILRACAELKSKVTDARCKIAALTVCKVAGGGILTEEIDRFFGDEIRLRYNDAEVSASGVDAQIIALTNWTLRHAFPVHELSLGANVSFRYLDHLQRCCVDVCWSFAQWLFDAINKEALMTNRSLSQSRQMLKLSWPAPNSFSHLVAQLSDRTYIGDTRRLASFNYLDLSDQTVAEVSYGAIITEEQSLLMWVGLEACNCNFSGCEFYGSDLGQGVFQGSSFHNAHLQSADLTHSDFQFCDFSEAKLTSADVHSSNMSQSVFTNARLAGCNLSGANFSHADLRGASFSYSHTPFNPATGIRTCLARQTIFDSADMQGVDFFGAELEGTSFKNANLRGAVFLYCICKDVHLEGALLEGALIAASICNELKLSSEQQMSMIILDGEDLKTMLVQRYGSDHPRLSFTGAPRSESLSYKLPE